MAEGKEPTTAEPSPPGPGRGLLGWSTDAECVLACIKRIGHLEMIMRECCDAIRDQDDLGALKMLEATLQVGSHE